MQETLPLGPQWVRLWLSKFTIQGLEEAEKQTTNMAPDPGSGLGRTTMTHPSRAGSQWVVVCLRLQMPEAKCNQLKSKRNIYWLKSSKMEKEHEVDVAEGPAQPETQSDIFSTRIPASLHTVA